MPWVRMLDHISGGRHDGREWPPANGEIEVPEWEAKDLIAGRLAVPAGGGAGNPAASAPQAEAPAQQSEPGAGAAAVPEPAPSRLPGRPPAVPVAPPEVSAVTEVSPVAEVGGVPAAGIPPEAAPEAQAPPEPVPEPEPEVPAEPPAPHDIKQQWIDYAVVQGENPDTARDMTKADLMSKYGGRL